MTRRRNSTTGGPHDRYPIEQRTAVANPGDCSLATVRVFDGDTARIGCGPAEKPGEVGHNRIRVGFSRKGMALVELSILGVAQELEHRDIGRYSELLRARTFLRSFGVRFGGRADPLP